MARDELPPWVMDRLYANEHGLLRDRLGSAVRRVLDARIDDPFCRDELRSRVAKHKIAQAFAGPLVTPFGLSGEVTLGVDARGRPVRVPVSMFNAHVCTLGGSGSGKTNRARVWAIAIAAYVTGMWLLDIRKSEFPMLIVFLRWIGVTLEVVHGRDLRFNPLQVPVGVEPISWSSLLADILVHALGLPQRASKLLHTTLINLYREWGVHRAVPQPDASVRYPTLFDLRRAIALQREAHPQARAAVIDALDPVLLSLGTDVLGYSFGWTTWDLARRHLVFDLSGLARADQDLLLSSLLLSEFASRVARGYSNHRMDLLILLDEAQRLFSASRPSPIAGELLGLVRGGGVGLDVSLQSAYDLHPSLLSNSAMKCLGRCGSATDYDVLGAAMGLTREQRVWAAQHLQPGEFVVQLGEGPERRPFLLRVPLLRVNADTGHEGAPSSLKQLTVRPAEPLGGTS